MAVAPPPNVMLNLSINMKQSDARDLFLFLANRKMGRERAKSPALKRFPKLYPKQSPWSGLISGGGGSSEGDGIAGF